MNSYSPIRIAELLTTKPISALVGDSRDVRVLISQADLSVINDDEFPEVIGIQRIMTLATVCPELSFEWDVAVAQKVFTSPALFPILSVVLCLEGVSHFLRLSNDQPAKDCSASVVRARKALLSYRLKIDAFMDCQIVVCADSLGQGYHPDLYERSGVLNDTEGMEALVEDLMVRHLATGTDQSRTYKLREILGVILSELFENTETHGKRDLDGNPIPKNGLRGLIIKRVQKSARVKSATGKTTTESLAYLELSIFDSGIGFYPSFTRQALDQATSLDEEWKVMHHCMERHVNDGIADIRPGYRGMGLYEVLRALMIAKGFIEIRTGRVYAYRTFLEGDMRIQLEPKNSDSRPGMPKAVLLDSERKFVTVPTNHEALSGSAVRVIFPLL